MITVLVQEYNQFSQDFYDSVINNLQLHRLTCSCGRSACLGVHAYYKRQVHSSVGSSTLRILRLKCSECGRTHAVLLSSIVPYDQLSLEDQRIAVQAFEEHSDPMHVCTPQGAADENNIKSVIRRYRRHWRERLRSEGVSLSPVGDLVKSCFRHYSAQFLQIHRSTNILFPNTT